MNKAFKALLLGITLCTVMAPAGAGVVIGGTRFVFPEGEKSISFTVRNADRGSWLIYSKVSRGGRWPGSDMAEQEQTAFVATPQLFSLHARRENNIRIINTDSALPQDRETLFTLNVASIPPGKGDANNVQTAVRSRFKLFYRPATLPGKPDRAYQALRWVRGQNAVTVENPTPYFVTLYQLSIDGQTVDNSGLVAPFAKREFTGCRQPNTCQINWQTINDYGRVMPVASQLLR